MNGPGRRLLLLSSLLLLLLPLSSVTQRWFLSPNTTTPHKRKNATTIKDHHSAQQQFAPGSLNKSRLETFRHCYVDPKRYQPHFRFPYYRKSKDDEALYESYCSVSARFKVVYLQVEKAGSSTTRAVMARDFEAQTQRGGCLYWDSAPRDANHTSLGSLPFSDPSQLHYFTVFREPSMRFVSSYSEMLRRWLTAPPHRRTPLPAVYASFGKPFGNVTRTQRKQHNSTAWQRVELQALEQFVNDYDAAHPFDTHLRLQVPGLSNNHTGQAFQGLHQIMETRHLDDDLAKLSQRLRHEHATPLSEGRLMVKTHAWLQLSQLSTATRRKICQLTALDYCCLNYPLPDVCEGAVQCRWILARSTNTLPDDSDDHLIDAVSPFPPSPTDQH